MSEGSAGRGRAPGSELEEVLDPHLLDDLERRPTGEVRELRAACELAEEGVSYARRLLQGRVDILRAELLRRGEAGDDEAESVLDRLPAILGSDTHATEPLKARAQRVRVPPSAQAYEAMLDEPVGESELQDLEERGTEELEALVDRLGAHERHLSEIRRQLFARIDALRDELAARYKDGRATVSDILAGR